MIRRIKQNIEVMKIGINLRSVNSILISYLITLLMSGLLYWREYIHKFESFGSGINVINTFRVSEYMNFIMFLLAWTIITAYYSLSKEKRSINEIINFLPINKCEIILGRLLGLYLTIIPATAIIIMVYISYVKNFYIDGIRGVYLISYILVLVLLTLFNISRFNEKYHKWERGIKIFSVLSSVLIIISIIIGTLEFQDNIVNKLFNYIHSITFVQLLGERWIGSLVVLCTIAVFNIFNYLYVRRQVYKKG